MIKGTENGGRRPADDAFHGVCVGSVDVEITQLESRLRAAQLSADLEALSTLVSDRLLFAGPDGNLLTKTQDIDAYRSGLVRFLSHEPLELQVRRLTEGVAVASVLARLSISFGGNAVGGTYRYMRIWHRESDGCWRVAAGQVSQAQP